MPLRGAEPRARSKLLPPKRLRTPSPARAARVAGRSAVGLRMRDRYHAALSEPAHPMLTRILLALSPPRLLERVREQLREPGLVTSALVRGESLTDRLTRRSCDLVVLRRADLGREPAMRVQRIRTLPEPPDVIVVATEENPSERAALLAAGCLAVVYEGLDDAALGEMLRTLVRRRRDEDVRRLRAQRPGDASSLEDFVSASPAMVAFLDVVRRVVESDSSLLLLGETGVGKERLAQAIHNEGPRAAGPFLALNCAALPETLLESELFGHEEGAFTGATRPRRGHFELAHGGTIFLDEVGEMPLHLQVKLLRVLQDRRIHPVGAEEPVAVDVRVMAATNRDLAAEMAAGRFRPDLYYRLGVVTLTLPPLRERREDVPQLAESYIAHFRGRLKRPVEGIAPRALEALCAHSWPGNVRELINVLERAVLLASGPRIDLRDLPPAISGELAPLARARAGGVELPPVRTDRSWHRARAEVLEAFERRYLSALLEECNGRVGEAARRARIDPRSLYDKMKRLGLRKEAFRPEGPLQAEPVAER